MKRLALLLCVSVAPLAWAERAVTIGEYTSEVRGRVAEAIKGVLKTSGRSARVSGTVTYAHGRVFFLQKDDDGIKVLTSSRAALPQPGDGVTVYGSPGLEGGRIVFKGKSWKLGRKLQLPKAKPAALANLLEDGEGRNSVNWQRVEVKGRALGLTENGFALSVDGVPINVMIAAKPAFLDDCERTHPLVAVRGVAELLLDQSALTEKSRDVMGVKINVAATEDIVLCPDWQYLSRRRGGWLAIGSAIAIAVLALALAVFLVIVWRQRRRLFRSRTIMAERKRMADDLHDTIEQHLVGAGMLLKLNRLKEAEDVLVRAKREIRDIVWGLKNDDMMRLAPADMLRQLAHDENTKGICRVDTKFEGLPDSLNAAAMRDLSLIVREAIGNAVKHGGAKHIAMSSDPQPNGGWLLRIANDGEPFDPATAKGPADGHFGLEGMRQRASRIGATISFVPRKGGMVVALEKKHDQGGGN